MSKDRPTPDQIEEAAVEVWHIARANQKVAVSLAQRAARGEITGPAYVTSLAELRIDTAVRIRAAMDSLNDLLDETIVAEGIGRRSRLHLVDTVGGVPIRAG